MSARQRHAQMCLVAVCAHMTISPNDQNNLLTWLSVIKDVLPDCEGCPEPMIALRGAARAVLGASDDRSRNLELARLQRETRAYYALAAGKRFEIWQKSSNGCVQA